VGWPVRLWISDKQEAFVSGIAQVFPGVPHRYCENHFLRDLAKPVLEADSKAKVAMRQKVRGLRSIEQDVLAEDPRRPKPAATGWSWTTVRRSGACSMTIHGGPLQPPGLKMAEALGEIQSRQRNLATKKGADTGAAGSGSTNAIDRGLAQVQPQQQAVKERVDDLRKVAATLDPDHGTVPRRRALFRSLQRRFQRSDQPMRQAMAKTMNAFVPGLFVGEDVPDVPRDNLDLERFFRGPKGHERRIHGHRHAGVRIVVEGPTLIAALDAHLHHPGPFPVADLQPYVGASIPASQAQARQRRGVMRQARSPTRRPLLLDQLERRYHDSS
jgi:hypothetical protein